MLPSPTFTTGSGNTALGSGALFSNTETDGSTAVGFDALTSNTNGAGNTAVGFEALLSNTDGEVNTANGYQALQHNIGDSNTAFGYQALISNNIGFGNTAVGTFALDRNTTGVHNTAVGDNAGINLTTGDGNVCIGAGVWAVTGESNTTRIRNIGSSPISGGVNVVILGLGGNGGGILGYASSSRRYKQDIADMDKASETLFALKPVTFRPKGNSDQAHTKYYGLIAEDVATVDPDLVVYNSEGKPETLRFDSINAMLLNEFLKEHRRNEEQEATIARLQKQVEALAAGLQKVSVNLE